MTRFLGRCRSINNLHNCGDRTHGAIPIFVILVFVLCCNSSIAGQADGNPDTDDDVAEFIISEVAQAPDGKTIATAFGIHIPIEQKIEAIERKLEGRISERFRNSWRKDRIFIWDSASLKRVATLPDSGGNVMALSYSPDNAMLAAVVHVVRSQYKLQIWNTDNHQLIASLDVPIASIWDGLVVANECFSFSPDSKQLAVCTVDGLRVYSLTKGENSIIIPYQNEECYAVVFAGHGNRLITAGSSLLLWEFDGASVSKRWVLADGNEIRDAN